ncbi:hypothetical protein E3U36_08085 [Arsenophonus endosymbiont of Aphis craccivora]|uniref:hypothetical protein n=1 Tax=Arsenophonus endosymbiont of Aphis craccivora TaxID=1231049 RepID=UPI0015DCB3A2|nr:hypothetical protein [Arsenophonus endosymbiont of Aphis craccivora]QLK88049.1 hypothetical protein E3U36_08085 [Arsenophonus endosymbiont of Aphis craccivora]
MNVTLILLISTLEVLCLSLPLLALIHQGTPTIKVQDNRGLAIRTLEFYRTTTEDPPEIRLIQQKFSAIGNLLSQQDPRLTIPNFLSQTSLTGNIIHTKSQDSGNLFTLNDIEGRSFYQQDARHTQRNWLYESAESPFMGRLLAIDEQVANQPSQIRERFIYAPATPESQAYNLCVKSFVTMIPPAVNNNKVLPFKDIFKFINASYC